jgi:hypothetical protein
LEFCSRDLTTVRITYSREGNLEELVVTSAFLPYDLDEPPPTKEIRDVINHCNSKGRKFIIGSDANARHILCGSTHINPRGESLAEYLVSSNLDILNRGKEPTFVITNRKEVIDLTLGTNHIGNLVRDWHVSDESFVSDHRNFPQQSRRYYNLPWD